jgi:VWFA-related protein
MWKSVERGGGTRGPLCRVVLVGLILASVGLAQAADEASTRRAFFEPLDVPLVSVDLYVTDRDGRPVPGLTTEDFVVYEDGVEVAPTHFYAAPGARAEATPGGAEEADAEAATAQPTVDDQLLLAVWIDETGLQPRRRSEALGHLRAFLTDQLPEGTQVALVSFDGGTRIRQTFTGNRAEISASLDALEADGASVSRLSEEDLLIRRIRNAASSASVMGGGGLEVQSSDFLGEVQAYAAQAFQRAQHSFRNLGGFVDSLSVLPGQKVVLVVSDAVNPRPGERVFSELQDALGSASGVSGLSAMNFGRRYDLSREFRLLLEKANTNRVTFMALSAMAERSLGLVSAENKGSSVADVNQIMVEEQALLTMAGVTGGKVLENSPALPEQLSQVAEEVASYYSIGYPPPTPGDGKYHRLKIEVRGEGLEIRHREGYLGTGSVDGLVERTVAAAMLDVVDNPLAVRIEALEQEAREDDMVMVPILVRVPIGELVLVPGAENHEGQVSLVLVVQSADGGLSDPVDREYPILVPNGELVQAIASAAGYTLGVVMEPGPHRIAVGVRDALASTTSTVVAEVEVGAEG